MFKDIIFISAQPDETFFIWQLEIQLRNFRSLGIKKDKIHVLVAFNVERGLSKEFKSFIREYNRFACFFAYADLRKSSKYKSSIRPHILKRHFETYKRLEKETFFYHDSDILLSQIPFAGIDISSSICYVSDTREYLDINYILESSSVELFDEMLKSVGIDKQLVVSNDNDTGGAQYLLNGISSCFWDKVEKDAEGLYCLMHNYNSTRWEMDYAQNKILKTQYHGIQEWCADMWSVYWNLLLFGRTVKIHSEMEFSWAESPIEKWHKNNILHYTGNVKDPFKYFDKTRYLNFPPWYDDDLLKIPDETCSYIVVNEIRLRRAELDRERQIFSKCCIILYANKEMDLSSLAIFDIVKKYICKYLNLDIFFLENFENSNLKILNNEYSDFEEVKKENLSNYTDFLILPFLMVVNTAFIKEVFSKKRKEGIYKIFFLRQFLVHSRFVTIFEKILDIELFSVNDGKFLESPNYNSNPVIYINSSSLLIEEIESDNLRCTNSIVENIKEEKVYFL